MRYFLYPCREKIMENTPLSSIKVSDETFQKLQKAAEISGLQVAEIRRLALDLGLDSLERIGFKVKEFTVRCIADESDYPAALRPRRAKSRRRAVFQVTKKPRV